MEGNMLQVMEDMKGFFNLSLSAIGFFAIANFLRWLAPKAFETATWPNLGKIYEEYFSMLYGILFGVFMLVLCARLNLLRAIVDRMASEENATGLGNLKYFPWIASPFHKSVYVKIRFWIVIVSGTLYLGFLSVAHIRGAGTVRHEIITMEKYKLIGYLDGVIFIMAIVCMLIITRDIQFIQGKMP